MNNIFDIIDNISNDSIIIITILYTKMYNVSIIKNKKNTMICLYELGNQKISKFQCKNNKKFINIKKYILKQVDNIPIKYISGISSNINKSYLNTYFNIIDNNDTIINFNKSFL